MTDAYGQEETLAPDGPRPADAVQTLARGTMLGRYVVIDTIGRGAMGVVVAAYDPELDRKVAIKLLRGSTHDGPRAARGAARLLREAQALAKLAHPNVVAVYDVGTIANPDSAPAVFVAMELLVGQTVATWLERERPGWREVLDVFLAAGRGLEAAHVAGVIHRDFKPDNILLTASGRVVVLDFGLARADPDPDVPTPTSAPDHRLTMAGAVMGTPAFMSPEQAQGRELAPASDQFSFCAALHLGLFGELPYPDEGPWARATWDGMLRSPPQASRVPAWVRACFVRGLEKDPNRRFSDMTELLAALGRDPSVGRRRLAGAVAIGAALAATWWVASRRGDVVDPCVAEAASVDAAWPRERRSSILEQLTDGTDLGDTYARRVVEGIDAHTEQLRSQRIAACRAAHDGDPDAIADAKLRIECLDRVREHVDALAGLLDERGIGAQDAALSAVNGLPSVERCRDAEMLRRSMPLPDDPERGEELGELRIELARLRSFYITGDAVAARDGTHAIMDRVRATGDARLTAEALVIAAGADLQLADHEPAIAMAEEAYRLATASGADLPALHALGLLTIARTLFVPQLELATWHSEQAEALVHRLGDPPEELSRVLSDRARLARKRRDSATEISLLERAEALLEANGVENISRIVILDNLANAHLSAKRNDEAVRELEHALELAARTLGPRHNLRANVLTHLAQAYGDAGDRDRGIVTARTSIEVGRLAYGDRHPSLAAILNTAAMLVAETNPSAAIPMLDEARAILAAHGQKSQLMHLLVNTGDVAMLAGDRERALELHREALTLEDHSEDLQLSIRAHVAVADDLIALGRLDEAMQEIAAAYRLRAEADSAKPVPHDLVVTEAKLAIAAGRSDAIDIARRGLALAEADETALATEIAAAKLVVARALHAANTGREERLALAMDAMRTWARDPPRHRVELAEVLAFSLAQDEAAVGSPR